MSTYYTCKWETLSHSNPDKTYVTSKTRSGEYQCSCPHWKFNRNKPNFRPCPHVRDVMADPFGYRIIEGHPDGDERNTEHRARTFIRERERERERITREPTQTTKKIKSRWDIV